MTLLKSVSFGGKYFQIAVTLREAHLINGMMSSAETWYGLRKHAIEKMEEVDKMLLRKILDAPISRCIESLYLEFSIPCTHCQRGGNSTSSPNPRAVYFTRIGSIIAKGVLHLAN